MQNKFIIRYWRYNIKNLEKRSNFTRGFSIGYINIIINIILQKRLESKEKLPFEKNYCIIRIKRKGNGCLRRQLSSRMLKDRKSRTVVWLFCFTWNKFYSLK